MFTTINIMGQEKLQSKAKRTVKRQNISLLMFSKTKTRPALYFSAIPIPML